MGNSNPDGQPCGTPPAWLRNYAGDEYFQEITSVNFRTCRENVKDNDLALLLGLDRLESVDLLRIPNEIFGQEPSEPNGMEVTDAGLAYLERLPRLRMLNLDNTRITDAGLATLSRMGSLEEIDIERTKVTVAGLAHLRALKGLRELTLNIATSTDRGLA